MGPSQPVYDDPGVSRRGNQRAPHKALLVLYALGRRPGAGGPDKDNKGPALCVLHHKALMHHQGRRIGPPQRQDQRPTAHHLARHAGEVFRERLGIYGN